MGRLAWLVITVLLPIWGCGRSNLLRSPADQGFAADMPAGEDMAPPPDRGRPDRRKKDLPPPPPDLGAPDGWPSATGWALSSQGKGTCGIRGLAVDKNGAVYISGGASGDFTLDGHKVTVPGGVTSGAALVARLHPSGKVHWVKSFAGASFGEVALGPAERPHIVGGFRDQVTLNRTYTAKGNNLLVTRMSPSGGFAWVAVSGGAGYSVSTSPLWPAGGIAVDGQGRAVVTGSYRDKLVLGKTTLTGYLDPYTEMFIAQLDTGGRFTWAVQAGGKFPQAGVSVAADSSGNIYATGTYYGAVNFGPLKLNTPNHAGSLSTAPDGYLARLSSAGKFTWVKPLASTNRAQPTKVALDPKGGPVMTGTFYGALQVGNKKVTGKGVEDVFVARFNPAGSPLMLTQLGGYSTDAAGGIASDGALGLWVTGGFNLTAYFGGSSRTSVGGEDVYLARWNIAKQVFERVYRAGGWGNDRGVHLAVDRAGNVYLAGQLSSKGTFGKHTLDPGGGYGCFIWKLGKGEL